MRWFRLYVDVLDDFKLEATTDHEFRAWIKCLCLSASGDGKLPSLDEIAYRLRLTRPRAEAVVNRLRELHLIDEVNGELIPHNWCSRQYKSDVSTDRVRAFRERSTKQNVQPLRNVSCNRCETPSDTDTDTDTPIVPKGDVSQTLFGEEFAPAKSDNAKWFAEFWAAYPKKVAKKAAIAKYKSAAKTLAQHEAIMVALRQQLPGLRAREYDLIPYPATWLGRGQWEDEPTPSRMDSNAPREIPTVTPEMLRRMTGR